MISRIIAVIFAVQLGLHAANVYSKFGFFAACIAIVFMLAFGEVFKVMDQDDKITIERAITFYQGAINSVLNWLAKFRDGRPQDRRGAMDIQQQEEKLRVYQWTLKQLERSR